MIARSVVRAEKRSRKRMRTKGPGAHAPAVKKGLLFVMSGPSGSGKTTLMKNVIADKAFRGVLSRSVSFTTRKKRSGEREGKDYFFVTKAAFRKKLKAGDIFEWTHYLGNYYGTPRAFVEKRLAQGKSMVFCLDFKGALEIKKRYPESGRTIFVSPSCVEALPQRIQNRCVHTKQGEIKKRVALARREMRRADRYDYRIINNELECAVKQLKMIITDELARR